MPEKLNPKDCPICNGEDGQHVPFAGRTCPMVNPKGSAYEEWSKEVKELERLFRLTPSVRI